MSLSDKTMHMETIGMIYDVNDMKQRLDIFSEACTLHFKPNAVLEKRIDKLTAKMDKIDTIVSQLQRRYVKHTSRKG